MTTLLVKLIIEMLISLLLIVDSNAILVTQTKFEINGNIPTDSSKVISANQKSKVGCAMLCSQNDYCSGIYISQISVNENAPSCYLSVVGSAYDSMSDQKSSLLNPIFYERIVPVDPCANNPCNNSGVCTPSAKPAYSKDDFVCNCTETWTGKTCDVCVGNFAGPTCEVDTSDSVQVDGSYFYIHGEVRNGKDNDNVTRPNCTESRKMCDARGMNLLTIKDSEKMDTVLKLKVDVNWPDCFTCFYQLGLSRMNTSSSWTWDDGELLGTFQPWYPGQPDDASTALYAAFSPFNNYTWLDIAGTFPAYTICEYVPT